MKLLLYSMVLFNLSAGLGLAKTAVKSTDKGINQFLVTDSQGAELQLEVRQMPLAEVLNSIADKTHVPIHYSVLPEGLVTATCVGQALKQVLECLLDRKADLIVRYPQTPSERDNKWQVMEAWILGSRLDGATTKAECPAIASKSDKSSFSLRQNEYGEVVLPNQINAFLKIAQSANAAERAEAIGALISAGYEGDPTIRAALEEALHDKDANVRAQAISSFAHREGNAAIGAIQDALHDESVDVRLMAVDGIVDDVGLLQQAVNDSDEAVRTIAAMKLEQVLQPSKTTP